MRPPTGFSLIEATRADRSPKKSLVAKAVPVVFSGVALTRYFQEFTCVDFCIVLFDSTSSYCSGGVAALDRLRGRGDGARDVAR